MTKIALQRYWWSPPSKSQMSQQKTPGLGAESPFTRDGCCGHVTIVTLPHGKNKRILHKKLPIAK